WRVAVTQRVTQPVAVHQPEVSGAVDVTVAVLAGLSDAAVRERVRDTEIVVEIVVLRPAVRVGTGVRAELRVAGVAYAVGVVQVRCPVGVLEGPRGRAGGGGGGRVGDPLGEPGIVLRAGMPRLRREPYPHLDRHAGLGELRLPEGALGTAEVRRACPVGER